MKEKEDIIQKVKGSKNNENSSVEDFCQHTPVTRLLHFIKDEKPQFKNKINPKDLFRVIFVKSKMNNERIIAQSGSFLLFGLDISEDLDSKCEQYDFELETIEIHRSDKEKMKKALDSLSINDASMFPSISEAAKYIKEKYI